jgi:hypothetical protein
MSSSDINSGHVLTSFSTPFSRTIFVCPNVTGVFPFPPCLCFDIFTQSTISQIFSLRIAFISEPYSSSISGRAGSQIPPLYRFVSLTAASISFCGSLGVAPLILRSPQRMTRSPGRKVLEVTFSAMKDCASWTCLNLVTYESTYS